MIRRNRLRVEVLEDRCVPAVDPLMQTMAMPVAVPPPTYYVIDPPLIDPHAPPPPTQTPPPPTTSPLDPMMPTGKPYVY